MDERKRYEEGMKSRRAVLGDAHVERAQKNRTPFNEPFQDLITRYTWGEVWSRPGLPRKTRSLLTLSMLVALNREPELRMHLQAALSIGVTREEIQEVFLQAAIYCGVPAANSAFHTAQEVFERLNSKKK
jgi:4-carboxymuconolactone decarboxylase